MKILKKEPSEDSDRTFGEGEKAETADVEVTWEKGEYKGEAEKTYTLSGTLGKLPENVTNTKNLKAEIKVEVTKKEVNAAGGKRRVHDYSQCKRFEDGNCEA